ncbi:hydrolase [Streptomyces sp. NBC_00989]|uniref:hydrolase n=1 Tax=Streptomyces sp. NBC_00989 TaxID=2903705 RepID=UPI0038689607|nr:hydrolase [Streptomyces sp. NBC_00989]
MSLWTSLEPASATVDPGGSTRVRLRLRNTGDVVDEYRFEPVGSIAPWTVVEPQTLRLYPGTTGTVDLTFAPPRTPDATAGPNPYAVRITPTEHPEAVTVPEGNLTITPFTEVRAELVPPTVKGRFRGRPRLAVDNLGNTRLTASISGSDNGDQLSYDIHPGNVQIEPGRAAFVKASLKPRKIIWFGPKEQRPYTLSVLRSGANPLPVEGTYLQRGFLPRWLATFLGAVLALSLTFLMLWIAYKPQVRTAATEQLKDAGVSTLAPAPSPTASVPPPPTATATTPPPAAETSTAAATGGGGGGSSESAKPKVKPATAATAVKKLAAKDAGRHICYRAFIAGDGWTDAVCDGAATGTVDDAKQITALNIAVSGSLGSAANAFIHNPASTDGNGMWEPQWTAIIPDNKDNYVGSSKADAPYMTGFAINIGSGQVCESARNTGWDWGGQGCADARPKYIFGGTLDNSRWLVAVKFTV